MREMQPAARGIKCFEYARSGADFTVCQDVEQRRFAGIRVAHDGEDWKGLPNSARSPLVLMTGKGFNLPLQMVDALSDTTSICFELRFARPSAPDAATQA